MRFLLGVMHPRRLDYFLNSIKNIDYIDIALAKNMKIIDALTSLRDFTLENGYDYLILTSDDTVIPYLAPAKVKCSLRMLKFPKILTGYSRISTKTPFVNLVERMPEDLEPNKYYPANIYMHISEVFDYLFKGKYIIPVWFVGWSLTAMHRTVLEDWKPRAWMTWHVQGGDEWSAACDMAFSYDFSNVTKLADLTIYVPHIPTGRKGLLVGKEPPELEYIKKKENKCSAHATHRPSG